MKNKEPVREATNVAPKTTVLVVDDFEDLRLLVRFVLERAGYEVFDVESGAAAVELSTGHEGPIDLLITDVTMPGLDGSEVAKRIRAARPGIAVLFMSGTPYAADELDDSASTAHAVIQKPFMADEVLAAVRTLLGE